ncbi:ZNF696 isoform 4 [Pan troglodytes]|uniref:ZNF696 isoform 4 n=1 Tax=Pan troglodytes TaxID=9598 RepID=A0A2J8LFQ5_PANTR|nr:ZNF696 isoform 4 [Pan troglodytes]
MEPGGEPTGAKESSTLMESLAGEGTCPQWGPEFQGRN